MVLLMEEHMILLLDTTEDHCGRRLTDMLDAAGRKDYDILKISRMEWQTSFSLLSPIIIRTQSGSMKETVIISKLGKFQTCTVPESQNT